MDFPVLLNLSWGGGGGRETGGRRREGGTGKHRFDVVESGVQSCGREARPLPR